MVACDNGFGHVRRVATVAAEIARRGGEVTVFAREDQARRFGLSVIPFETRTSPGALRRDDAEAWDWHERLPPLGAFDLVVSDNLPEILLQRQDAVLMGSFLWHRALEGLPAPRVARAEELLRERPEMLGSGLFAAPELAEITRFVDIGLVTRGRPPRGAHTDLLLACGMSGACESATLKGVESILRRGPGPFRRILVEPRLVPNRPPEWMMRADFSRTMYGDIVAAVVRPGAGTSTDAIHAGCRLFCFYEQGNRELSFNAGRIASHGLGVDAGTVERALELAYSSGMDQCTSPPAKVPLDGAASAADHLLRLAESRASAASNDRGVSGRAGEAK